MKMIEKVLNWEFMDEPAKRWFLFFGLVLAINFMWALVIKTMRDTLS